jgi:hypothetical protein
MPGKSVSSAQPGGDAALPEVSFQHCVDQIPVDTRRVAGQLLGIFLQAQQT